jgi:hypothetical protein
MTREYFGCIIERNTEPGYRLRWSALTPSGMVAADTLAGIKQLIKERLDK